MLNVRLRELISGRYPLTFPIRSLESPEYSLLTQAMNDNRTASLGDSLVNFLYSCAKSLASGTISSNKLPDKVLVNGLSKSKLSSALPTRADKKKTGNILEALLLIVWAYDLLSLEELTARLRENLVSEFFSSPVKEASMASAAFARLFDICYDLIFDF